MICHPIFKHLKQENMPKQEGALKLSGTLDNLTFYRSRDGFLIRLKSGVSSARFKTDPAFQRTRENGQEFGRAAKAGQLLRRAVRPLLVNAQDARSVSRLLKLLLQVLHGDPTSPRGLRTVGKGAVGLLEGFEFNEGALFSVSFGAPFTGTINRAAGSITLDVPSFVPSGVLTAPSGATHFQLLSAGAELDFEAASYSADVQQAAPLAINNQATAPLQLVHTVNAGSTNPLLLVVGVHFFQQINGVLYPLKIGAYNAAAGVKVGG
jgi:hypothetical protein